VAAIGGLIASPTNPTILTASDTHFRVNGRETFLLGMSYYGGLGASAVTVTRDMDMLRRKGFNWVRVWATWTCGDTDVSAVDGRGKPRQPYMDRLVRLVDECGRRGLVVDVTLSRGRSQSGGAIPDLQSHEEAVRSIARALSGRRNWYLDLANEHDVRDERYVPTSEVRRLGDLAHRVAPDLLTTASFGGHDLSEADVRTALVDAQVDFLAPHRPRHGRSPSETEEQTRLCLSAMRRVGRLVPIHYQEPFRRGYGEWEPGADDFLTDLQGAVRGGAAGWCLHNGSTRGAPGDRPTRSFDLREQALFAQLDAQEMAVVNAASALVRAEYRSRAGGQHP